MLRCASDKSDKIPTVTELMFVECRISNKANITVKKNDKCHDKNKDGVM